ncbi:restriction endonuclease subunit S [Amycolatopsis sp. NPDC101161]|uniref:restriction endonuclease subunit S n=1 Tax=Amycolatopsis sp. NPDC101161 TaxID=3363940 RepID=UPI0037F4400A
MNSSALPTGWKEFQLGDLFKLSNGINAGKSSYGSGTPFINVLEVIENESLRESDISGLVTLPPKAKARYEVRRGDVLFNRTSETQDEVGLASVYLGDAPVVFGGFVFRGRPVTSNLCVEYAKYALRAPAVRRQITSSGQGGIRANVGQRDLKSVTVMLPDIPEQRAISGVLDDISTHIRILERLIAKKQAIKQAMLQQLLMGHAFFEGSLGPGDEIQLGAITTWLSGGTPDRNNATYWGGTIPWISAATLKHSRVYTSDQHLTEAGLRAGSKIAPAGATLILVRGMALHRETRIGMATRPVSFNQDVKALIPKPGILPEYLMYALQARSAQVLDLVSSAGSGTGVLDTQLLQRLSIWVPDESVQSGIVTAVDAIDRDVENVLQAIAKARAIKQGMSQELLSGRTRLSVQEPAL